MAHANEEAICRLPFQWFSFCSIISVITGGNAHADKYTPVERLNALLNSFENISDASSSQK